MKNKLLLSILSLLTISVINTASAHTANCSGDCHACCVTPTHFSSDDSYRYVSVGVGPIVFIPNLGVGYRQRNSLVGYDTALSYSTVGYVHQLNAQLVGLYYLNPTMQNSAYLGLGLLSSGVFPNKGRCGATFSSDFVFGKELERKHDCRHFIEMHVAIPTLWVSHHAKGVYLPLMYIKYGMSF